MVTVFLRGGLGNQMFQYAAGVALAKKNSDGLFVDTAFLNDRFPRKEFTYRTFDLDIFSLQPKFTTLSKVSNVFPIPGIWLGVDLLLGKIGNVFGYEYLLRENEFQKAEESFFKSSENIVLWGFWQNEKYFKGAEKEVRTAFTFKNPLEGEAKLIAESIHTSTSVAIHVRRGDYLLAKYAKVYAGTDLEYYARAVEYIKSNIKNPHFFVFSDDIAWCKEHLKIPSPVTYVEPSSSGPKASYHLELMSLCKHNIIANSTFSWWGAWLNVNPEKIVIAPKHWYVGGQSEENDIVPSGWIKL